MRLRACFSLQMETCGKPSTIYRPAISQVKVKFSLFYRVCDHKLNGFAYLRLALDRCNPYVTFAGIARIAHSSFDSDARHILPRILTIRYCESSPQSAHRYGGSDQKRQTLPNDEMPRITQEKVSVRVRDGRAVRMVHCQMR